MVSLGLCSNIFDTENLFYYKPVTPLVVPGALCIYTKARGLAPDRLLVRIDEVMADLGSWICADSTLKLERKLSYPRS